MRCGKCCLTKGADDSTIWFTNKMCAKFDFQTGCCSCYATRLSENCLKVDLRLLTEEPQLLPETCPYRLLLAGKDLPDWHPLVSGNPNSAHEAKQTVLEIPEVYSEKEYDDFVTHIRNTDWREKSDEERAQALQQLDRYDLVYIESYPIPPKP